MTVFRDITFLAAGPARERRRSAADLDISCLLWALCVDITQTSIEIPELTGCMNLDRFFAAQIDSVFAVILALIAATQFGSLGPIISWTAVAGAYFGYFLLSEALFGNTFGKWSMGLRIRSLGGQKCTVRQSVIRSMLRLVEVNPLILGALPAGAAMFFSKRRQRFGDMLAGTVVVQRSR